MEQYAVLVGEKQNRCEIGTWFVLPAGSFRHHFLL